ncbi:MAG TPA: membrane protein insertase YidC, partial [Allosphingosinicella sp.]|nr:membrane protein insertase YidC [Allosphingosinicella sp.]
MSNDNRNMILAIVLSAIVLFGWGFLTQSVVPTANPPAAKTENGKQAPAAQAPAAQPQAAPAPAARRADLNPGTVVRDSRARGERIEIRTPRLSGTINLVGARIDDLVLAGTDPRLGHRDGIGRNAQPIRLFSPDGTPRAYHAGFGWSGAAGIPAPDTSWRVTGCARDAQRPAAAAPAAPAPAPAPAAAAAPPPATAPALECDPRRVALTPSHPVTLTHDNGRGQVYTIVLRVDDGYLFTAEQSVVNRGA